MFADLPPQLHERVYCSITAAVKYRVPANIVLAIAEKEGGQPGQWVRNTNGSHDVGPMQFNTDYLASLKRYGITAADVAANGCYSFDLATWRIRKHIRNDSGDVWTRAANYHSRNPQYNSIYRADLIMKARKWAKWLETRFNTYAPLPAASGVLSAPTASPQSSAQPAAASRTVDYVPRMINGRQ